MVMNPLKTDLDLNTGLTTMTSLRVGVPVGVPVIPTGAPIRIDLNKEVVSEVRQEATTSHKRTASQEEKSTRL